MTAEELYRQRVLALASQYGLSDPSQLFGGTGGLNQDNYKGIWSEDGVDEYGRSGWREGKVEGDVGGWYANPIARYDDFNQVTPELFQATARQNLNPEGFQGGWINSGMAPRYSPEQGLYFNRNDYGDNKYGVDSYSANENESFLDSIDPGLIMVLTAAAGGALAGSGAFGSTLAAPATGTTYGVGSGAGLGFNASGAFGGASSLGGVGGSGLGFAGTAANTAGWGGFGAGGLSGGFQFGGADGGANGYQLPQGNSGNAYDFGSPSDWGGSPNGSFEYTGSGENMDWGDLFQSDQDYFNNFEFPSNADVASNFDPSAFDGFSQQDLSFFDDFQFPTNADTAANSGWFDTIKNAVNNPLKSLEEAFGLPAGSINTAQKALGLINQVSGGSGGSGGLRGLFGGGSGGGGFGDLFGSAASAILTNSQKKAIEGATTTATDMADPFAKERPQYQGQLRNLMTNPAALEGNAAFQNMFNTGLEAVNRTASAKGQLNSGNRLTDLMDYGQKKASEFYFPQAQLLGGLAGANAGSPASAGQFKLEGTAAAQGLRSKQAGDLLYGFQPQQNQNQTLKQLLSQWG